MTAGGDHGRSRAPRGSGQVVKRGRLWYVRRSVTVRGVRRRVYGHGYPTELAAEQAQRSMSQRGSADQSVWTWGLWFDEWFPSWSQEMTMADRRSYMRIVERHVNLYLRPLIGNLVIAETTLADLDAAWLEIMSMGRSRKTAQNVRGSLRLASAAAVRRGIVPFCIVNQSKLPAMSMKERRRAVAKVQDKNKILTRAEAQKVAEWCIANWQTRPQFVVATLLALDTGARRGEILGIRWRDVDFGAGAIRFDQQVRQTTDEPVDLGPLKSIKSHRTISVPERTMAVLKEKRRRDGGVGDRLVFCNPDGSWLHPDSFTSWVGSHLHRHCGLGNRVSGPHQLRHTHASLLLSSGVPITEVSERLGHSTVVTTMNTYSHGSSGEDEKVALLWERLFEEEDDARQEPEEG